MQTIRRIIIVLLLFLGLSATLSGALLIANPTGSLLKMPISMLKYSPFSNFLIPGLLLFLFEGVSALVAVYYVLKEQKLYPFLVVAQGFSLLIWIVTQIIMIRGVSWLHFLYGGIGLILIILGVEVSKRKTTLKR